MSYTEDDVSGRPKLSLQPRGSGADQSSSVPAKTSRPNPFGTARPREQVIAEREGKKETDVLKEQAQKEWKPSIVLTDSQREEKKAAEAELAFTKSELAKEIDPMKSKALKEEVAIMENKLQELLGTFEKMALQTAQSGGGRRTYDRRDERVSASAVVGGNQGIESQGNFTNFSRGRERDVDRGGSYGDTWGAKVGGGANRPGGSQCFNCGEIGHFSRECPNAGGGSVGGGSYGNTYGGGSKGGGSRQCYTCGQEGHFSRECPQSGGFGMRGGAYGGGNYAGVPGAGGYGSGSEEAGIYGSTGQGGNNYSTGAVYDNRYAYGSVGGRGGSYPANSRYEGYGS